MSMLKNFLKGIVAGIGGIAPGLSGSVLLVILGAYERMIQALGTLFKDFKKNIMFLLPIVAGMGVGVLLFSKAVDFLLETYEYQTRYTFLGLIVGTIPLFYREVKKKGFHKAYYLVMIGAAAIGFGLFGFNRHLFPQVTDPNLLQSVLLGVAVAGSSIVPGVDSAAIMSAFGLYELYVNSLATLNLQVLLPAAVGLAVGAVAISLIMNWLLSKVYTGTFSVIFGLFLSIIPSVVMNESCYIASVPMGFVAVGFALLGMIVSLYLGDIEGNNKKIRRLFKK
jgi:putative membrane protein